MYCAHCGQLTAAPNAGGSFCPNCGKNIDAPPAYAPSKVTVESTEAESDMSATGVAARTDFVENGALNPSIEAENGAPVWAGPYGLCLHSLGSCVVAVCFFEFLAYTIILIVAKVLTDCDEDDDRLVMQLFLCLFVLSRPGALVRL